MNLLTELAIKAHVVHWRLTWNRRDLDYRSPARACPLFKTAREAAAMVSDGAVVATSGLGGNQRSSLLYWAIRDRFERTRGPRGLTIVCVGGQGGRGRVPGTLEELARPGLLARLFTGHAETLKAELAMADRGELEVQILPQGTLALLLAAQGEGVDHVDTRAGVGTVLDPRTGRGTPLTEGAPQYVEALEGGALRYRIPKVDTAIFSAPAADRDGNVYVRGCAMLAESLEIARAARRNGGRVIVSVGRLVDRGHADVFLRASEVDAIVHWPGVEQTASIPHTRAWDLFTTESTTPLEEGVARVRVVNDLLGVTPRRRPADAALARLATRLFVERANKGDHVDIGVGLPEEVARVLHEGGALRDLRMINESGVLGGMAAPGIFFDAAVNPTEIVSSATAFRRIYERLDWAILGALEFDERGDVNVSRRGDGCLDYVGPGGFMDLVTNAKNVLFCASFGERARVAIRGGEVRVVERGTPKLVPRVREVTFSADEARKAGQRVLYVTHLGAFELGPRGLVLTHVMPGVDVARDVVGATRARIELAEGGPRVAPRDVVTGEGFRCDLRA
jgi:propionate CoA-transferase